MSKRPGAVRAVLIVLALAGAAAVGYAVGHGARSGHVRIVRTVRTIRSVRTVVRAQRQSGRAAAVTAADMLVHERDAAAQLLALCREVRQLRGVPAGSCEHEMPPVPSGIESIQDHHEATLQGIAVICEHVLQAEGVRTSGTHQPCGQLRQDLPSENTLFH